MPNTEKNGNGLVGIFWWFQRRLITDTSTLSEAEPYGDLLTHAIGHLEYWTALQAAGAVPAETDYAQPPRGRVSYDMRQKRFLLYTDACILRRKDVVTKILAAFHLLPDTRPQTDSHYRCFRCLSKDTLFNESR